MTRAKPAAEILDETVLRIFPPTRRYLIGVSGGRDSVALLHSLGEHNYHKLIVCHLHHRLRGRSSEADARFVRQLAKKMELPFELGEVDVRKVAAEKKLSIETAARNARYEFFASVARRRRCSGIFLGHHADDLVETFLFNLFRGSGSEGLGSIRSVSTRGKLTLIRPMLGVWRKEIDAYVARQRLKFREDASNSILATTRNRLRHRIIPFLEKEFGREIRQTIWRTGMITAEENSFLENSLSLPNESRLRLKDLRELPLPLQRRAIRSWLRNAAVANVGFDLIERVRALLDASAGPAKVNLPNERYVRRRAGELFFEEASRKVRQGTQR